MHHGIEVLGPAHLYGPAGVESGPWGRGAHGGLGPVGAGNESHGVSAAAGLVIALDPQQVPLRVPHRDDQAGIRCGLHEEPADDGQHRRQRVALAHLPQIRVRDQTRLQRLSEATVHHQRTTPGLGDLGTDLTEHPAVIRPRQLAPRPLDDALIGRTGQVPGQGQGHRASIRRDRMRKRLPSGASTEKPEPRPSTTSRVRWVCFQ